MARSALQEEENNSKTGNRSKAEKFVKNQMVFQTSRTGIGKGKVGSH